MKNLIVASKVRCIVPGVLARDLCRHTGGTMTVGKQDKVHLSVDILFLSNSLLIAEEAFKYHKSPVVTYLEFRRSGWSVADNYEVR